MSDTDRSISHCPATVETTQNKESSPKRDTRFWLILVSLCLGVFASALDFTGIATALPTIAHELHGSDFTWVGTSYAIASTTLLPLNGGLAEIFGRRVVMLSALVLFGLGSALCGSAKTMNWLIAARVVQGLGGGGLISTPNIIISDLVPLHERGAFQAILGLSWAFASSIGPLVGGALAEAGKWRWFFYLNLPVCGMAFAAVVMFVKLPTPPGTLQYKIKRIDWIGNLVIVASSTSLVIGMTWGGVNYPWSSGRVLVTLILGAVGLVVFFIYEGLIPERPLVPWTLLRNRTSVSGYLQTFLHPMITVAAIYYLATYYQACKDASSIRSAVLTLTLSLISAPLFMMMGLSVTKLQVYRPQLWVAWCIYIAGTGGLIVVRADSHLGLAVGLSVLLAFGSGAIYGGTFFPVLSPIPVSENAYAVSFLAFCRSFAGVWGIAIGGAILQNELRNRLPPSFLEQVASASNGTLSSVQIAYSVIPLIRNLPEPLKHDVRDAFGGSIAVIWKVMTGIGAVGFLCSLLMKDVPLHTKVDMKWAVKQENASIDGTTVCSEEGQTELKDVA